MGWILGWGMTLLYASIMLIAVHDSNTLHPFGGNAPAFLPTDLVVAIVAALGMAGAGIALTITAYRRWLVTDLE